jgi:MFS family permease
MAQIYLLSVVANIVAGFTLAGDYLGERASLLASFKNLRDNRGAMIGTAIGTLILGVLSLIIRSPGERVPVAGDLLPALAGIALGLLLLFESRGARGASEQPAEERQVEKVARSVLTYRVPVGLIGAGLGFLHFLLPGVLVL